MAELDVFGEIIEENQPAGDAARVPRTREAEGEGDMPSAAIAKGEDLESRRCEAPAVAPRQGLEGVTV
jgi:hypothetical protein